jgi:hypothetical protein
MENMMFLVLVLFGNKKKANKKKANKKKANKKKKTLGINH